MKSGCFNLQALYYIITCSYKHDVMRVSFLLSGKENQDESLYTGGSSKSDNSEENAYSDCKLTN